MVYIARGIIIMAAFLVLTIIVQMPGPVLAQSSISRDISSSSVSPDGQVNVTLNVAVAPGIKFYIIDEIIPEGWSILDGGTLIDCGKVNASESRHLKIVEINGASDTKYTYMVKAPSSKGSYSFSGIYYMDGKIGSQSIGGTSGITVGSGSSNANTGTGSISGSVTSGAGISDQTCSDGIIESGCECQGVFKDSGYCCGNEFQTIPCDQSQGPLPVLDNCTNGDSEQCGSNIGACSYGTRQCNSDIWSDCSGGIAPSVEIYDGIDNDCDGETDEDCSEMDIARCEQDATACVCGVGPVAGSDLQGNLPMAFPSETISWFLIIIGIIIASSVGLKGVVSRRGGAPFTEPLTQPLHQQKTYSDKESMLMAMKGVIED